MLEKCWNSLCLDFAVRVLGAGAGRRGFGTAARCQSACLCYSKGSEAAKKLRRRRLVEHAVRRRLFFLLRLPLL